MDKDAITESLRKFVERRDDLLHEDLDGFALQISRFMELCDNDELIKSVLTPVINKHSPDVESGGSNFQTKK